MNQNFRDMLFALSDENAEFLIIGAFALAFHGMPRSTGDIDILVGATPENAERVWRGLLRFGAPLTNLSQEDFSYPRWVVSIGREPSRIDLLTVIDGVDFATAWRGRTSTIVDGRPIPIIGLAELLVNKQATGRPKDLLDVAWIEKRIKETQR